MSLRSITICAYLVIIMALDAHSLARSEETHPHKDAYSPDVWRREHRIVDMHMHIEGKPERFELAEKIMDAAGIGVGIELGSGTVTTGTDGVSDFERVRNVSAQTCPGRFVHYMLLDYKGWDESDWSDHAAEQITEGHRLGAAGLKEFKRLGLNLRDGRGNLIRVDDPKLDAVWQRCGELRMPVSIHVGDPKAFWEPLDPRNERWNELRDHPDWWFGDRDKYPPRMELLKALERVIARHPNTTFVCVHFANNPEDIDWVDKQLDRYPNMMADLAARIPEIGRQNPEQLRKLFIKHQDRILFGTDFQVWSRYILGSAGDNEKPTDYEALVFFRKCYRFLETDDRDWVHMTPIQGDWTISSINLPAAVLRKVYFDNARKLLSRSYPAPILRAAKSTTDFEPDGHLTDEAWTDATPQRIEYGLHDCQAHPGLSTSVRALWSDKYLYVGYEAPYTELTVADKAIEKERIGLWSGDVVELFIAPSAERATPYFEWEWAPNGERLDVRCDSSGKDFSWTSGEESVATIDPETKTWRIEARIPLSSLNEEAPTVGARWRANLFRHDKVSEVFLAWNPTLTDTTHVPDRFGVLEFVAGAGPSNSTAKYE